MLETLVNHNDHHNAPLYNEKLQKTEEEERNAKHNADNVNMDTFYQPPVTTYTQRNISNITDERNISSEFLAEPIKGFKGLTLQSTISNFA